MADLFKRLDQGRPEQNGTELPLQDGPSIEDEQARRERLEARLDVLAADLQPIITAYQHHRRG
jgi:hypothetical protein